MEFVRAMIMWGVMFIIVVLLCALSIQALGVNGPKAAPDANYCVGWNGNVYKC